MNTEETEFTGWTYDHPAEAGYKPLKIVKVAKYFFWDGFCALCAVGMLKAVTNLAPPHGFLWVGAGILAIGIVLAFVAKSRIKTSPVCSRCRKSMRLTETIPTQQECEKRGFIIGKSGHAYTIDRYNSSDGPPGMVEIRKQWYCCQSCRRYLLLDGRAEEHISNVEDREARYASFAEARKLFISKQSAKKSQIRN